VNAEAPLISSSVMGPLGVAHLPRLWLKILLHACDRLPEGYRHGNGGFDELLFTNLGIDGDAFVDYIATQKPDYRTLEAWVRSHATKLTPEAIAAHNAHIFEAPMLEERAVARRAELGITDGGLTNAVKLNDLDDWSGTHARLVGRA
jgi:Domain of unknown function (DUF5069)